MSLYPFRIGPLPGINLPFKLDKQGACVLGKDHGTHADIYGIIKRTLGGDEGLLGPSQQAMNLGYVMMDRGWTGTLVDIYKDGRDATILTSAMWSMCQAAMGVEYELWYDNHWLKWSKYSKTSKVMCEVDGWDLDFTAKALRQLFGRIYE